VHFFFASCSFFLSPLSLSLSLVPLENVCFCGWDLHHLWCALLP
jgi:hypothetical protein